MSIPWRRLTFAATAARQPSKRGPRSADKAEVKQCESVIGANTERHPNVARCCVGQHSVRQRRLGIIVGLADGRSEEARSANLVW